MSNLTKGLPFEGSRIVHSNKLVTKGLFGDRKETIGGYIIVKAVDADEVAELTKGAPVLQGEGNTVEVRKIYSRQEDGKQEALQRS